MGVFDILPGLGGDGEDDGDEQSGDSSAADGEAADAERPADLAPGDFRERAESLTNRSDVPTLDYTVESLDRLDDLADSPAGPVGDDVAYGSYLGETLVRSFDGEWVETDGWQVAVDLGDDETTVAVFDAAKMSLAKDPVFAKVAQRLEANGAERRDPSAEETSADDGVASGPESPDPAAEQDEASDDETGDEPTDESGGDDAVGAPERDDEPDEAGKHAGGGEEEEGDEPDDETVDDSEEQVDVDDAEEDIDDDAEVDEDEREEEAGEEGSEDDADVDNSEAGVDEDESDDPESVEEDSSDGETGVEANGSEESTDDGPGAIDDESADGPAAEATDAAAEREREDGTESDVGRAPDDGGPDAAEADDGNRGDGVDEGDREDGDDDTDHDGETDGDSAERDEEPTPRHETTERESEPDGPDVTEPREDASDGDQSDEREADESGAGETPDPGPVADETTGSDDETDGEDSSDGAVPQDGAHGSDESGSDGEGAETEDSMADVSAAAPPTDDYHRDGADVAAPGGESTGADGRESDDGVDEDDATDDATADVEDRDEAVEETTDASNEAVSDVGEETGPEAEDEAVPDVSEESAAEVDDEVTPDSDDGETATDADDEPTTDAGDEEPTDADGDATAETADDDGSDEDDHSPPGRHTLREAAEALAEDWPERDLDFTPQSLPRLDAFIDDQWEGRFDRDALAERTVDHADDTDPLTQVGAYYGEVLVRWLEGEWVATDDGEGAVAVPDVGERREEVPVFAVARECLADRSTFAYRYDALVNQLHVDRGVVSDGRPDVYDGDRDELTSADVITQFAATAEELVEAWPDHDLDYSPRSLRRLDALVADEFADDRFADVSLADGTDHWSLALTARATDLGAYFAVVLVRHCDAQWRIDDDVELVIDDPTGETTVDPVATAADCLAGERSFAGTYRTIDE